jgi:hypothetical protein
LPLLGLLAWSTAEKRSIKIHMKRFLTTAIALFSLVATFAAPVDSNFGVGAQYDTTHVYVPPEDFDKFVASLLATFGGTATKQGVLTLTPTPSLTMSQLVLTPAGTVSVFGFKTPVPYPFGAERTGYLVSMANSKQSRCDRSLIQASIRRECLDHVIVWNETSLRRILRSYFQYYEKSRTHLALAKDAPEPRAVDGPENGRIVAIPQVGGLHHRYERRAT